MKGGFIVVEPNLIDYKKLIEIVLNTKFVRNKGWDGTLIGAYWGGYIIIVIIGL